MTTDPAIIEAAARALEAELCNYPDRREVTRLAAAVLAAVTPLIEAAALERVAKAMDRDDWSTWEEVVAAVTCALKEQP